MIINDRWQARRGTAADLAAVNEVNLDGEFVVTTDAPDDAHMVKIGDGLTRYNDLPFFAPGGSFGSGDIAAINEQTGTAYTLVLADATKGVRMTNAAACTLTIPTNATAALPLYRAIPAFQGGAGKVTWAAASGVTLEAPNGAATTGPGDFRTAFQRAPNIWVIG